MTVPSTRVNVAQTRGVLLMAGLPLGAHVKLAPCPIQLPATLPLPSVAWMQR